jgi:mono/diheme cytochrome c family protein
MRRLVHAFALVVIAGSPAIVQAQGETSHAAYLKALDGSAFKRGEEIYTRTCQICHGTVDQPGSLPDALRFAQGKFQNGHAPHELFHTLRTGFRQMPPQGQLSDKEAYDVIHYIRENFVKPHNPSQYTTVDPGYLDKAAGMKLAVQAVQRPPWQLMDYGPTMAATFDIHRYSVKKGIAVRLDPGSGGITKGSSWVVFDQDTLQPAAGWDGVFSDYNVISVAGNRTPDDQHQKVGTVRFTMPNQPAWADPATGKFDDLRHVGPDQQRYGPLPYGWGRFEGIHYQRDFPIMRYRIGERHLLEQYSSPWVGVFQRVMHVGAGGHALRHRLAPADVKVMVRHGDGARSFQQDGYWMLEIPAGDAVKVVVTLTADPNIDLAKLTPEAQAIPDLAKATQQIGAPRWNQTFTTTVTRNPDDGPYVVDAIPAPTGAPWHCRMRLSGIDFFPDQPDSAAVCTWDGCVWRIDGITTGQAHWRRIATGLFQPLGLKIHRGDIYVTCRDQIARLVDQNADGEADCVEAFNGDHMVTTHWHEFTSGLIVDPQGRFYYTKAGRHSSPFLVPHHGTCIQVDPDGKASRVVATGFRATNGLAITSMGEILMTDQEGNWRPENTINLIQPDAVNPPFFGFTLGYHQLGDRAKDDRHVTKPVLWVNRDVDRSPAELLEVDSQRWGGLEKELIAFSYGYGKIFHVAMDEIDGQRQGAYLEVPIRHGNNNHTPAGLLRGRFHPKDGQLYTCGLSDWASSRTDPSGLYRVRHTGKPSYQPRSVKAFENGIRLDFADPIKAADDKKSSLIHWDMVRSGMYGMRELKHEKPAIPVKAYHVSGGGKILFIECAMPVTDLYELTLRYTAGDDRPHDMKIHASAYRLHPAQALPLTHPE